jgi:hypothetical protein
MTVIDKTLAPLSRRHFLRVSASAAGGLAIGFAFAGVAEAGPVSACSTLPSFTVQAAGSTFHCTAAAWIRRALALAPACCRNSRERRTALEPPVPMR